MTDRIHALTVHLDKDIREDDIEPLVAAIRQLRHVASVDLRVATASDYIARERVRFELQAKVHRAVQIVFMTGKVPGKVPSPDEEEG